MKRILIPCLLAMLAACGDDDDDLLPSKNRDSGISEPQPGVCDLSACPVPKVGVPCCTPLAQCGYDDTGTGLSCTPNSGQPGFGVCELDKCPQPTVGTACCTPYATCGFDPFSSGLVCFGYPVALPEVDAGPAMCDPFTCPQPDIGYACCVSSDECGVDPFGIGLCFPTNIPVEDAGPAPPIVTEPPDDPSVDGQCPSYWDVTGPVWGCCSDFGVCGTFAADTCLLDVGTPLPIDPDSDAGLDGVLRCTPPER